MTRMPHCSDCLGDNLQDTKDDNHIETDSEDETMKLTQRMRLDMMALRL